AARAIREGRQARRRSARGAREGPRLRQRRDGHAPGRDGAARRDPVAVRGREEPPRVLGRRGALDPADRLGRTPAPGGDGGSGREDPARRGPLQQRPPRRKGSARRGAVDLAQRLLGPEPDRLPDGGLVSPRNSVACFARGLALSLSKPYLAVSLWLIQLLLAAVLILPISNALHDLLDHSVAGSHMVANPDYGLWETLQRKPPALRGNLPDMAAGLLTTEGVRSSQLADLRGIGAAAVSLAFLAVVLHAFALGGVFGTLREPTASLVTFGREGMRR